MFVLQAVRVSSACGFVVGFGVNTNTNTDANTNQRMLQLVDLQRAEHKQQKEIMNERIVGLG